MSKKIESCLRVPAYDGRFWQGEVMRWLRTLMRRGEIIRSIEKGRLCSRLAVKCAARSTEPFDAWAVAARTHRARRDAFLWQARQLAG